MDPKRALTKGVFCPMPWKGLMYNFDGTVKNCIRSAGFIGDIKQNTIQEILTGETNTNTQQCMLNDTPGPNCYPCYQLENGKKQLDIISDRIFYIRELRSEPYDTYQSGAHDLKAIDVRWTNLCNFACIYCNSEFSSRWAKETNRYHAQPSPEQLEDFKNYVYDHADKLKHVYLAGGEPLLMKQNLELLNLLQTVNPDVNLRINTNLSKTNTRIFEKICEFPNVHWTLSVETMGEEFEYIRHGGKWQDFLDNLEVIKRTNHKVSFNMLYYLLNYESFFDTVEFLQQQGFHNNSFIAGALLEPIEFNIRHLPDHLMDRVKSRIGKLLSEKPGYLLEDSLKNILDYINQPFEKNIHLCVQQLRVLDQRRGLNSKQVFAKFYNDIGLIW